MLTLNSARARPTDVSEHDSRPDDAPAPPVEETDEGPGPRYAHVETETAVVVYDRENHRAWVQSDAAVALDAAV